MFDMKKYVKKDYLYEKNEIYIQHKNLAKPIQKFKFSSDGMMLAAVMDTGKKIVVVNVKTQTVPLICVRGITQSTILSVDFYKDNSVLMVANNKGTIHLFNLKLDNPDKQQDIVPKIKGFLRLKTPRIEE